MSKSDPFVVVYEVKDNKYIEIGRTEVIVNNQRYDLVGTLDILVPLVHNSSSISMFSTISRLSRTWCSRSMMPMRMHLILNMYDFERKKAICGLVALRGPGLPWSSRLHISKSHHFEGQDNEFDWLA